VVAKNHSKLGSSEGSDLRCGQRSDVKKPGFRPTIRIRMDARVKPGHDEEGGDQSTRLLSFTFSASRYTCPPISLNLALICAMPSSITPDTDIPTPFSIAACEAGECSAKARRS
jgi:hypothetical protein